MRIVFFLGFDGIFVIINLNDVSSVLPLVVECLLQLRSGSFIVVLDEKAHQIVHGEVSTGVHLLVSILPSIEDDKDDVKLTLVAHFNALLDHILGSAILCVSQLVQI